MQKIAIIGSGNVGSQVAMLLVRDAMASDILLLDIVKGLAKGKALDLEDYASLIRHDCDIEGSDDFFLLKDSGIVVVTAGLARKPGMTRDDLLQKNSRIISDVSLKIKQYAGSSVVIIVTNPVDIMTSLAQKETGFSENKVFGMGIGLDSGRFANLIAKELNVPIGDIDPVVIGSHGQSMVPLPRLTRVTGTGLERLLNSAIVEKLTQETVERGASIVANLGSGSAFFAPAQAVVTIVKAILKDEKRVIGVCAYLSGEYGESGLYLGVPARVGKNGIEGIVELELNDKEKEAFRKSAQSIRGQISKTTA